MVKERRPVEIFHREGKETCWRYFMVKERRPVEIFHHEGKETC